MARGDEDILLGPLDPTIDRDSDGDGPSDLPERLEGPDLVGSGGPDPAIDPVSLDPQPPSPRG